MKKYGKTQRVERAKVRKVEFDALSEAEQILRMQRNRLEADAKRLADSQFRRLCPGHCENLVPTDIH